MNRSDKIFPGATFQIRKPGFSIPHLWIILTYPEGDPLVSVWVNITTNKSNSDITVILNRGDHPFIKHESIVYYQDANFVNVDPLIHGITDGTARPNDPLDVDILERIQRGLFQSPWTKIKLKQYCREKFPDNVIP